MPRPAPGSIFRQVLILESRDWFHGYRTQFDPLKDLVLTYDLGLKLEVEGLGGQAFFVDHLVDPQVMQTNNFLTYQFFRDWHLDAEGNDIFTYRDVPFGFSFRIEIWNDLIFQVRTHLCLARLRELHFESLHVGTSLGLVESTLDFMGLAYEKVLIAPPQSSAYFFPIHRWMDERLRTRSVKHLLRDSYTFAHGTLISWIDKLLGNDKKPGIYIQEYHPTRQILQKLKRDIRLRVLQAHYSWAPGYGKYLSERVIPVWGNPEKFQGCADTLMRAFQEHRSARLVLSDGTDVSDSVYPVIERRVASRVTEMLRTLECIIRYMDQHPVNLVILIGNLGLLTTLLDCVAKRRGVPSYLIINGMLGNAYLDEGKYATYINAYSSSIKTHYFRGVNNVVCLGDPRMDAYAGHGSQRKVNREKPTITIGASGHNNTDLNSYLAVEFDFMHDVLSAIRSIKLSGVPLQVVIKVRANGYKQQYQMFADEYFPGLVDEILDTTPMAQVLEITDFLITIYSQTLFEASCLGIPCLYYIKDNEIMDPPFDGRSELVTVDNVTDLVGAITDFRAGHPRFEAFMQREIMEKYIGYLDGDNLRRNLQYIHELVNTTQGEHGA